MLAGMFNIVQKKIDNFRKKVLHFFRKQKQFDFFTKKLQVLQV